MLNAKTMSYGRPALSARAEVEAPHQKAFNAYLRSGDDDGLRGLTLEGKAMSTAVAPMVVTWSTRRRRSASSRCWSVDLVAAVDCQCRAGRGDLVRRARRPQSKWVRAGPRKRRPPPKPRRRPSSASRSSCMSWRRCRKPRSVCWTTAPSTWKAGWPRRSRPASSVPRLRPSSTGTAWTSRRASSCRPRWRMRPGPGAAWAMSRPVLRRTLPPPTPADCIVNLVYALGADYRANSAPS